MKKIKSYRNPLMTNRGSNEIDLHIRMAVKTKRLILQRSFNLLRNQVVIETDDPVLFDRLEDIVVSTEDQLPVCEELFLRLETQEGLISIKQQRSDPGQGSRSGAGYSGSSPADQPSCS